MTPSYSQSKRRLETEGDVCCSDCDYASVAADGGSLRIATWASAAPTLQAYLNAYHANPNATPVRLTVLPSLRELNIESVFDTQVQTGLYDGFAIPPMMMTALYEHQGLANLNGLAGFDDITNVDETLMADDGQNESLARWWKDLLPYYKNHIAVLDGKIRAVPLFAGNQLLLLYRKDFFDNFGIAPPKHGPSWCG